MSPGTCGLIGRARLEEHCVRNEGEGEGEDGDEVVLVE